jgi:hypothetical protein
MINPRRVRGNSYPVTVIVKLKAPGGAVALGVNVKVATKLLPAVSVCPSLSHVKVPTVGDAVMVRAAVACPPLLVNVTGRLMGIVLPAGMLPQSIVAGEAFSVAVPVITPWLGMFRVMAAYAMAPIKRSMPITMRIFTAVDLPFNGFFNSKVFHLPILLFFYQAIR